MRADGEKVIGACAHSPKFGIHTVGYGRRAGLTVV